MIDFYLYACGWPGAIYIYSAILGTAILDESTTREFHMLRQPYTVVSNPCHIEGVGVEHLKHTWPYALNRRSVKIDIRMSPGHWPGIGIAFDRV